ncbi:MAG: hypothetical protein GY757_05170 [bacterium]|nr:hypothetical protein [bacterium]
MGKVTASAAVPVLLKDIKLDALGRNIKANFIVKFTTGGVTAMAEGDADVYGLKGFKYIIAMDSEDKLTALTFADYDVPVIGKIKLSFNVEPGQRDLTSTQKWEKLSFAGLELISPCITFVLGKKGLVFEGTGQLHIGGLGEVTMSIGYTILGGFKASGKKEGTEVSIDQMGNISIKTRNLEIITKNAIGVTFSPPDAVGLAANVDAVIKFKGTKLRAHAGERQEFSFDPKTGKVGVTAGASAGLTFGNVEVKADLDSKFSLNVSLNEIKITAGAGMNLNIAGKPCQFKGAGSVSIDPLGIGMDAITAARNISGSLAQSLDDAGKLTIEKSYMLLDKSLEKSHEMIDKSIEKSHEVLNKGHQVLDKGMDSTGKVIDDVKEKLFKE